MATVKLNTREYKDTNSNKLVKVRWRVKNTHFDKSWQASDIIAKVSDICMFDSDLNHGKIYDMSLLIQLQKRQLEIIELMNKQDWTDFDLLKIELDKLCNNKVTVVVKDVIYYFDEYIKRLQKYDIAAEQTIHIYQLSLRAIINFRDNCLKEKRIEFSDITKNWLWDLKIYLRNEHVYVDGAKDKSDRTISNYLTMFKLFLTDCVSNSLIDYNPFTKLTANDRRQLLSYEEAEPDALTLEELNKIKNLDLKSRPRLSQLRDAFVLQCYIGCRISDLKNNSEFKLKYYEDELGAIPYVEFLPEKTKRNKNTKQTVALTASAYAIYINSNWRKLPRIANYNKAVDKLFKMAKIEGKHATSHIARRTCESLIYQFQPNMYISGIHSNGSQSTKRYLSNDIETKLKIRTLAFDDKLYRVKDDEIVYTGEEEAEKKKDAIPAEILELAKKIYEQMNQNQQQNKINNIDITKIKTNRIKLSDIASFF